MSRLDQIGHVVAIPWPPLYLSANKGRLLTKTSLGVIINEVRLLECENAHPLTSIAELHPTPHFGVHW